MIGLSCFVQVDKVVEVSDQVKVAEVGKTVESAEFCCRCKVVKVLQFVEVV